MIWLFSLSVYSSESLRNVYCWITCCTTFTYKSHLAPTIKKRIDSSSRNCWHIQSEFLTRCLLGWASFLHLVRIYVPLHFSEIFRHKSHTNAWWKRQMSQTVGKFPGQLFRLLTFQTFSSAKCQMCHQFNSHCLKRFDYVPPSPLSINQSNKWK